MRPLLAIIADMEGSVMDKGTTSPTAQRNIDTIFAWLDAHNRRDMKAIDCYTDDIEIVTYMATAHAGIKLLAKYSVEELTAIQRFLEDVLALQQRMTEKLLEREQRKLRG